MPVSDRALHRVEALTALLDPWLIYVIPALLLLPLGLLLGGRGGAAFSALLAGLAFLLVLACLASAVAQLARWFLRNRRRAETFTLLLSPFAPHLAEEIWERLGHHKSLARRPWPSYDESKLTESTIELPVQVNGKVRDKVSVPADADEATVLAAAEAAEKVRPWVDGKTVTMRKYVPGKLVNLVVK